MEQTRLKNIPGILLQLDFQKSFDKIEWKFIPRTITLFNFGESIPPWVSTFYCNTQSAVINNGFSTNYFALSREVRQGCPLSPYLFSLASEVLACKISQDKEIQGINIFHLEFKISQFADDTTLLSKNSNSVRIEITVLNHFGYLSGLRLNPSKTKTQWLGPWRHRKENPLGFKWPAEPVRALGTYICYDEKQNEKYNFKTKLEKLQTVSYTWNCRNLTMFGRWLITKSLGISQLVHTFSKCEEFVLFNNKEIILVGTTIFYRNRLDEGVYLMRDLSNTDAKFLSNAELTEKYHIKCNFLAYLQVTSAIPTHLLERGRVTPLDKTDFLSEHMFQLSTETCKNLLKMKNKDCYRLLIKKETIETKASTKWARNK